MILSNQRFSALGTAIQSRMVACPQAACLRQSAAALLSSSGFVSVPVRSADLAGLVLRIREKGITAAPDRERLEESAVIGAGVEAKRSSQK